MEKYYIAITEKEWVDCLKKYQNDELDCVNFWSPDTRNINYLEQGELFLCKLRNRKSDLNQNGAIVGGGFVRKIEYLDYSDAWEQYGYRNGSETEDIFIDRIENAKKKSKNDDHRVRCIILERPFFFDVDNYLEEPSNWKSNYQPGKEYNTKHEVDKQIYDSIMLNLSDMVTQCDYIIQKIENSFEGKQYIGEEKEAIRKVRVNQGIFRDKLIKRYNKCCLCNISNKVFLTASHIKPWSDSNNKEKLDIDNGLLLCKNHDALFDKGFISFDNNGEIMISSRLANNEKEEMSIDEMMKINLTEGNKKYLAFHRKNIFKI